MPTTTAGRRAALLVLIAVALFGLFIVAVASGQRGGETLFSNPVLTVPVLAAAISAIAAGVVGVVALRRHDYSAAVIASTIIGALVLLWCLAEVVFPHSRPGG